MTIATVPVEAIETAVAMSARLSGVLLLAPVLTAHTMPSQARAVLVAVLTFALYPAAQAHAAPAGEPLVLQVFAELALGSALGLTVEFLFAAVDVGASAMSFATGLSFGAAVDPGSPARSTALMTFQWLMMTGLFLSFDGHHLVLRALALSFELAPVGGLQLVGVAAAVAAASSAVLSFGLALAAPALVILLLVDLTIGLVGRVAPHTHALIIGMGLKPLAGFLTLSVTYVALPPAIAAAIEELARNLGQIIRAAAA